MMTAFRFNQLKAGATPINADESTEYMRQLAGEARSKAAKRAVRTKRAKYTTWPTRKGDHTLRA